jgi:hypothetical protein
VAVSWKNQSWPYSAKSSRLVTAAKLNGAPAIPDGAVASMVRFAISGSAWTAMGVRRSSWSGPSAGSAVTMPE